jgi:hypothetical protein
MNSKYKFIGVKNRNPLSSTSYNYTKINTGGFVEYVNIVTRLSKNANNL